MNYAQHTNRVIAAHSLKRLLMGKGDDDIAQGSDYIITAGIERMLI
ncbi:MAG: hypothetical protein V4732_16805 [Pseudomonadota bacterium]